MIHSCPHRNPSISAEKEALMIYDHLCLPTSEACIKFVRMREGENNRQSENKDVVSLLPIFVFGTFLMFYIIVIFQIQLNCLETNFFCQVQS